VSAGSTEASREDAMSGTVKSPRGALPFALGGALHRGRSEEFPLEDPNKINSGMLLLFTKWSWAGELALPPAQECASC